MFAERVVEYAFCRAWIVAEMVARVWGLEVEEGFNAELPRLGISKTVYTAYAPGEHEYPSP
jgi:hypothetical protein